MQALNQFGVHAMASRGAGLDGVAVVPGYTSYRGGEQEHLLMAKGAQYSKAHEWARKYAAERGSSAETDEEAQRCMLQHIDAFFGKVNIPLGVYCHALEESGYMDGDMKPDNICVHAWGENVGKDGFPSVNKPVVAPANASWAEKEAAEVKVAAVKIDFGNYGPDAAHAVSTDRPEKHEMEKPVAPVRSESESDAHFRASEKEYETKRKQYET